MGLFDKLFGRNEQTLTIQTKPNTLYAPLDGQVIPLEEINDGVFSSGALGDGCGIIPSNETVVAPFTGEVISIAETKHAVGLQSSEGMEVLIHVGMDTVAMNGAGFQVYVKEGEQVKCGQKLLSFSKSAIKAAGYPDTTAILVTNSSDYQNVTVCKAGAVKSTEEIIVVKQ